MVIYISDLTECESTAALPYRLGCKMLADTGRELFEFADSLALNRRWVHVQRGRQHFRLTEHKREIAQRSGAMEVSPLRMRELFDEGSRPWEEPAPF